MSHHNGNQHPIDPELISAFYDGETTAEERAEIEQWMDDTSDTLQTLDEYDQLSQSLRDLHRASTSPDLRAGVMTQIASAAPAPTVPGPNITRGRLYSVVAGITGLAAAIMLLMWWPDGNPSAGPETLAVNEGTVADQARFEAVHMSPSPANSRALDVASEVAGGHPPSLSATMAETQASVEMSLEEMASDRTIPKVGDVLGYLDRNADEMTWVAVTVVDVEKAGNEVRLLLTRNGVPSPAGMPELPPDQAQGPDEAMTFLIEADWDQMEAVIVGLNDVNDVNSVVVDAPKSRNRRGDGAGAPEEAPSRATAAASSSSNAVQLQALVPNEDLQRIAARRSDGDEKDESAFSEAAEPEGLNVGSPLASRRARFVIMLQPPEEKQP